MKRLGTIIGGVIAVAAGLCIAHVLVQEVTQPAAPTIADVVTYGWPHLQLFRHIGLALASGFLIFIGVGFFAVGLHPSGAIEQKHSEDG